MTQWATLQLLQRDYPPFFYFFFFTILLHSGDGVEWVEGRNKDMGS